MRMSNVRTPTVVGAIVAIALLGFLPNPALAFQVVKIKATSTQVMNACVDARGDYTFDDEGFACVTKNCDGEGGTCSVHCNRGDGKNCTGIIPGVVAVPSRNPDLPTVLGEASQPSGSGYQPPASTSGPEGGTYQPPASNSAPSGGAYQPPANTSSPSGGAFLPPAN